MHTIDFESADFRKPEEKSPPLKSEPQPAESLVSENSRAQEIDSINTRIEEIQASPLWKKVFLRGTLEKELNELYRKRRELGGTETPLSETPDTSVLAKVSRYGALTKKAAREGFFEAPHTNETADEALREIFAPEKGKYQRTAAFFTFLRKAAPPELFQLLTQGKFDYDQESLPLDPERYQFQGGKLGQGGESTVFKLNALHPSDPSMVIKIDYRTEGEPTDDILKRGSLIKKEYEECREWYQDIPGFVPEEYHFIGKSPRGGHPALFTLQEYLGKGAEVRDIFREIGKEEFLREIKNDPVLAHDFRTLVPRMVSLYETQGRIIDTVGPKNVSLVETPAGKRLVLLDPHITSLPTEPNQRKEKMKNLEADLQYLKEILDEIGSQEGTNDSRFQQAA